MSKKYFDVDFFESRCNFFFDMWPMHLIGRYASLHVFRANQIAPPLDWFTHKRPANQIAPPYFEIRNSHEMSRKKKFHFCLLFFFFLLISSRLRMLLQCPNMSSRCCRRLQIEVFRTKKRSPRSFLEVIGRDVKESANGNAPPVIFVCSFFWPLLFKNRFIPYFVRNFPLLLLG